MSDNTLTVTDWGDMDAALAVFSRAGLNAHETALKLSIGAGLGMTVAASLTDIHMVEGRPAIAAGQQLAIARRNGLRHRWIEATRERATIELRIPGDEEPVVYTYTIAEANEAGLIRKDKPNSNWNRHPDAMLRARAITRGIRMYCPELLSMTMYDPDELREIPVEAPAHRPALAGSRPALPPRDVPALADHGPVIDAEPARAAPQLARADLVERAVGMLNNMGLLDAAVEQYGQPERWTAEDLDGCRALVAAHRRR